MAGAVGKRSSISLDEGDSLSGAYFSHFVFLVSSHNNIEMLFARLGTNNSQMYDEYQTHSAKALALPLKKDCQDDSNDKYLPYRLYRIGL